mgnify:CR=1 FL=1
MPQDACCCGTSVWSDGIILHKFYCLGIKTSILEVKSRLYMHKFLRLRFDDTKLSYLLVFYSCAMVGVSYSPGSWVSSWSRSISVSDSKSSSPGDPFISLLKDERGSRSSSFRWKHTFCCSASKHFCSSCVQGNKLHYQLCSAILLTQPCVESLPWAGCKHIY